MRNRAENKVEIFLFRHGATGYNLEGRYLGCRTDLELSVEGVCELRKFNYAGLIAESAVVFSGPMKRCIQTAEVLFPLNGKIIIPGLKEIDFGDFEGKTYKELSGDDYYQKWIDSGGTIAFPNGESREEFIERSVKGFKSVIENILEKQSDDDSMSDAVNRYAVILHGGNIMAILSHYCEGEYFDYQVKPGNGYRLLVELMEGEIKVISFEKVMV